MCACRPWEPARVAQQAHCTGASEAPAAAAAPSTAAHPEAPPAPPASAPAGEQQPGAPDAAPDTAAAPVAAAPKRPAFQIKPKKSIVQVRTRTGQVIEPGAKKRKGARALPARAAACVSVRPLRVPILPLPPPPQAGPTRGRGRRRSPSIFGSSTATASWPVTAMTPATGRWSSDGAASHSSMAPTVTQQLGPRQNRAPWAPAAL